MQQFFKVILLVLLYVHSNYASNQISEIQKTFFEKHIRPVLAEHCYECHNSVNKRKSDLALDYRDALLKGGRHGKVIDTEHIDQSILLKAIKHEGELKMPFKAPKLSHADIQNIEQWIRMGAPDPRNQKPSAQELNQQIPKWETIREQRKQWWSFQPLKKSLPPQVDHHAWQQDIDAFVYQKLKEKALVPRPKAKREILIRRLHMILTGLAPSPSEVKQFIHDKDPKAYEKLIDRLLNSKAYAERWARHWLDWYRYAETHGSEGDPALHHASMYRDYIIRALNQDVAYDQLIKEHIAGDLLKKPRLNHQLQINESAIGPAHFRMVPHGFGVTDAYDEQINFVDNQIDVLSKAMMGITISCARCHNHKFDPISQKDFYRFYGIMVSNKLGSINVDAPNKNLQSIHQIKKLKQTIRIKLGHYWLKQVHSETTLKRRLNQSLPIKNNQIHHPSYLWSLKEKENKDFQTDLRSIQKRIQTIRAHNQGVRQRAQFHIDFTQKQDQPKWYNPDPNSHTNISKAGSWAFHSSGNALVRGIYPKGIYSHLISDKLYSIITTNNFKISQGSQGLIHLQGEGVVARSEIRNYPLEHGLLHPNIKGIQTKPTWKPLTRKWAYWKGDIAHFKIHSQSNKRSWFGIRELIISDDRLLDDIPSFIDILPKQHLVIDQTRLLQLYQTSIEKTIRAWIQGNMSNQEASFLNLLIQYQILENSISQMPDSIKGLTKQLREAEAHIQFTKLAPGLIESEVIDQPLMSRGNYRKPKAKVKRSFIEAFQGKFYPIHQSGRLQLAEDMLSPNNTLKTRVLVNRLWSNVFGQGLVTSTDNFGRLGKKPSHPELLDYLALDFEKNGWSIKHTLKKMLMSRTFQSDSWASKETKERDPLNTYLSSFTPRRVEAEVIQDYLYSLTALKHKRSIYLPVRRNSLNSSLTDFNFPTTITTLSHRARNNIPAQALNILNHLSVKLSKPLIQNIHKATIGMTQKQKIDYLFMHCYSRPPSQQEISDCMSFLESTNNNWQRLAEVLLNTKEMIYVY